MCRDFHSKSLFFLQFHLQCHVLSYGDMFLGALDYTLETVAIPLYGPTHVTADFYVVKDAIICVPLTDDMEDMVA